MTFAGSVGEARAERRRLLAAGRPEPPPGPATVSAAGTLDAFAASYFRAKARALASSTVKAREEAYRLRVSPLLGDLELEELTRERVEVWLAEVAATSSAHAVWKAVGALRAILKVAVEWGRLPANPAAGLTLPRLDVGDETAAERVLDASQLRTLLATPARPGIVAMLRVAGEAGLRSGEVIGLRWSDVDLAGRRLTVRRNVWRGQVKEPKGRRARRVAISGAFAAALGDWYAASVIGAGRDAEGYVWPGRDNGPMGYGTPGQALQAGRRARRPGRRRRPAAGVLPRAPAHRRQHHARRRGPPDRRLAPAGPREPADHRDGLRPPARRRAAGRRRGGL